MYVAICDDEERDLNTIYKILNEYIKGNQFNICCFSSGEELLSSTKKVSYDIVVLDIEMKSPNGYEVALQLKKLFSPPLVIFATKSMAYTIQGYGVAFRYIPKPITFEKLSPVIDAAVREIRANRLVVDIDGTTHILHMQDVYYIEVYNHVTTIHTIDEEFSLRKTLKEMLCQLPQGYFGSPHQSYIVNFSHIKTATSQQVTLTNGVRIPVSRRRHNSFMLQLQSYLGR